MVRLVRVTSSAALTLTLLFGTACSRDHPGEGPEMQNLPVGAIGVVTVGPEAIPMNTSDPTMAFTFDEQGRSVGRIEGGAVNGPRAVSWKRGFTAATGDSVSTVTEAGRTDVPIDENMVEGAARDPQSGATMFWFNTGKPDGPDTAYRNNYVMTRPGQPSRTGAVPGMMLTAGHCGDNAYGVVVGFDALTSGETTVPHQLYTLPAAGGEPVLRGEWESPEGFRPLARTSVCSADGSAIYNLYGSTEARRSESGEPGLTLVRIDTATGARTETPVNMSGHAASARTNTLTLLNDRLYWVGRSGAILSLPLAGPHEVRQEWALPASRDGHQVSVTGTTVAHIDFRDTPTYSEFDLLTGQRTRGPIELPWLTSHLNSHTSSTVTSVASLPR